MNAGSPGIECSNDPNPLSLRFQALRHTQIILRNHISNQFESQDVAGDGHFCISNMWLGASSYTVVMHETTPVSHTQSHQDRTHPQFDRAQYSGWERTSSLTRISIFDVLKFCGGDSAFPLLKFFSSNCESMNLLRANGARLCLGYSRVTCSRLSYAIPYHNNDSIL